MAASHAPALSLPVPPTSLTATSTPPATASNNTCTFDSSHFKRYYDDLEATPFQHVILGAAHDVARAYCLLHNLDPRHADDLFMRLQAEAFKYKDDLLSDVDAVAQRLWTSALTLRNCGRPYAVELCTMLNTLLRLDHPEHTRCAAQLARNINELCVIRRAGAQGFPPGGVCYRGGGLIREARDFYTGGTKFRVPGYLATSLSEIEAKKFLMRAYVNNGREGVLWRIHLDPRGEHDPCYRCCRVNLVKHSNVPGEEEFLFAPYSVFTVRAVLWSAGTGLNPHVIDLEAAIDSLVEPQDLPLSPYI